MFYSWAEHRINYIEAYSRMEKDYRKGSKLEGAGAAGPEGSHSGDYEGLGLNESISCSVVTGYGRNKYEAVI